MVIGKINVTGTRAYTIEALDIPQGIVGATVSFDFSEEWEGLTKNVVFVGAKDVAILNIQDSAYLPPEVVSATNINVRVGVVGLDANKKLVIPTLWADLGTVKPAAPVDMGYDPTLPIWAQLMGMIGDLRSLNTEDKSNLVAAVNEAMRNGGDGAGGYYTPIVTQPTANTMQIAFAPSVATMPAVEPVTINLPGSNSGQNGNGGGITTNGKALLRTLLYGAVYDKDVLPDPATTIEAFLAELDVVVPDSGGTDEPDVPAEPDEPEKATYTVTYNLTSVTSSNTAASVTEGNSFTTVLSAASEIDTVTVKMGGVDITETAYTSASGIVTIPEVTGDIVITAKVVDNTVLYTIKDATIDGTRYVDTGVCIEDEEKDFTVVLNLTAKFSGGNNKHAIFGTTFNDSYDLSHLMLQQYNTTVDGVAVYGARLAYPPTVQQAFISVQADQVTPFKGRVIITHAKDSEILTVYAVNDSNPSDSIATKEGMSLPWGLSDGFTHTVTIGSPYRGTMPGTIHEFTIYNRVWSADEISAYLA